MAYLTQSVVRATGMDLRNATSFVIMTTNVDELFRFHPITLVMQLTAVSGFVAVPTISLGTNASNYDNLVPATALIGMSTVNDAIAFSIVGRPYPSMAAGTEIRLRVSVAANATTYVVKTMLPGIYD